MPGVEREDGSCDDCHVEIVHVGAGLARHDMAAGLLEERMGVVPFLRSFILLETLKRTILFGDFELVGALRKVFFFDLRIEEF